MIRRRLADLAAFDIVRYAQKACSNLAMLDLLRRDGALVDTVSAGEIRRALAAGYPPDGDPPPIVYTADIFDAESLDLVVERDIHVNCGSPDMIDQYGRRRPGPARSRCGSIPASATATARRPTPAANTRSTASGTSNSATASPGPSSYGLTRDRPAHAHRLRHRPGAPRPGLRRDGEGGARGRAGASARSAPAAACPRPIATAKPTSTSTLTSPSGTPPASGSKTLSATRCSLEIEPGRYLVAESGYLVTEIRAVKQQGDNLFYLVDAGFNNLARPILYGAYHPMSIVPADGDCDRPEADVIVGGPLCESGDIFTQEEGGFVAARRLPARRRRRTPGDRLRRGLRLRDGLELQLEAHGRRSPRRRRPRPADPPPPDLRRTGRRRVDSGLSPERGGLVPWRKPARHGEKRHRHGACPTSRQWPTCRTCPGPRTAWASPDPSDGCCGRPRACPGRSPRAG